jgi:hypothetical protein
MASTEQLIEQLSRGVQPVKNITSPFMLLIRWLGFSSLYLVCMLLVFRLRPDIGEKFSSILFVSEVLFLALVVITSSLSAILLSFPDMCQKRWLVFAPIVPVILFVVTITLQYSSDNSPAPMPSEGISCLICITMFSLFPAFLMFKLLRRQATTHYYATGLVSLLSATSIGAMTLRISENTDSILHLIKWHYMPILAFGIIGLWLGKKIFKW